jgi:hypothetical protein
VFRGQVVGAGTYAGTAISETPADAFVAEMQRWGVRHLFVWTDASRAYLTQSGRFVERWRGDLWSHFELPDADSRSAVTSSGTARLHHVDFLGADVELVNATAGEAVVVRANYYPAWRASVGDHDVALFSSEGQLAFRAPASGDYVVRLEYPRYRWLSIIALMAFALGLWVLARVGTFGSPALPLRQDS